MYANNTHLGGGSNTDEVVMVKLLILQQWYGLISWRNWNSTAPQSYSATAQ
ncbi:MAG: hypothetical protein NTV61_04230 [Candidatus Bathyarchaeota archaeon]|nr:hypothetical protein [Candidatus Bathyarchaeota archaeon]